MRVWDCFTYFDEVDLLRVRLEELAPVVDRFVIVESTHTFRGEPKSTFLDPDRYFPIVHVKVPFEEMPQGVDPWPREHFQRNAIMRGLSPDPDDIVIVSDLDEIPFRRTVETLRANPPSSPQALQLYFAYYTVNWAHWVQPGRGACVGRGRNFVADTSPSHWRGQAGGELLPKIENAGVHLSYLKSPQQIREKLLAFSHSEYSKEPYTDLAYIERCITEGRDLFSDKRFTHVAAPELPAAITRERFPHWFT